MSFFSIADTECNTEIADGVVVERRSVLWLSVGAVATLLGAGSLRGQQRAQDPKPRPSKSKSGKLTFEQFFAEVYPHSRRLVASKGEDEEAYLMLLSAAMSRLQDPAAPLRKAMSQFRNANKKEGERFPLAAMSMSLKPGKGFPHHDHLDYNGVIMGIEGEVRIRNYDFQGKPPAIDSGKTFQVRETRDDLILPGRFSSLGRNRENIHDLVAGKQGAKVLDVFTFFGKDAASRYLELDDKPRDQERRIFDAAWKPRRRR